MTVKSGQLKKSNQSSDLMSSSVMVSLMTMISRVVGLVRDIVLAITIGASNFADAFFVAFKIPQFLRRLFAEGAFAQAFVPVLSEYRECYEKEGNIEAVKSLINSVCGVLGGSLLMIVSFVVLASPLVTMIFAPGFISQEDKFQMTEHMLRITFPYLFLISLTGFAGAILNSYDRFVVPAFTPVLLNLSLIGFALFATPFFLEPVYALAWAVLFAGCLQFLFQIPFLIKIDRLPKPKWDIKHKGVKKILILMLPAIFGVSVSQINLLLDTIIASLLPMGSVSWLYYSDRLVELPLGVFGIAIATVILPSLSRLQVQKSGSSFLEDKDHPQSQSRFLETLDWAFRCIIIIAVPSMVALILLSEPILITLFQYNAMTPVDVNMASQSLKAYALGLLAFMAIKVLATGFYAQQDMKTPVKVGIVAMVSNMILNIIFVFILHLYWGLGHVGLALATSLSAWINALLLLYLLGLRHSKSVSKSFSSILIILSTHFWRLFIKVFLSVILMSAVLLNYLPDVIFWLEMEWTSRSLNLIYMVILGLFIYGLSLFVFGVRVSDFKSPDYSQRL
jgi:putative peptidoglycan lipid II flippase